MQLAMPGKHFVVYSFRLWYLRLFLLKAFGDSVYMMLENGFDNHSLSRLKNLQIC